MQTKALPGTVSQDTLRTDDLLDTFATALESLLDVNTPVSGDDIVEVGELRDLIDEARATDPDSEDAQFTLEGLFDALDTFSPDGHYFGAHEGDGAAYGFWPFDDRDDFSESTDGY